MGSAIDSSLLEKPSDELTRAQISRELWEYVPSNHLTQNISICTSPCWAFYAKECRLALHDNGRHVTVRTHRDIIDVARQLKADIHREHIKHSLRSNLKSKHANEEELLDSSINLAASLILMCDCGSNSSAQGFSGRTEVRWTTQNSLREFVDDYFGEMPVLAHDKIRLESIFVAKNFDRVAGLKVVWTDNLVDHLRLTDDDTKVHIFHHATYLECQQHSPGSLLPRGLATETLQTLGLLLPSTDRETREWFAKQIVLATSPPPPGTSNSADPNIQQNHSSSLDRRAALYGRLNTDLRQIERFHFWRDRLVMLKQVFDEAQPRTLRQWWHDRRNGVQWYTFWVAVVVLVLTIFFGLVQSIEGGLQVYASFKGLEGLGG